MQTKKLFAPRLGQNPNPHFASSPPNKESFFGKHKWWMSDYTRITMSKDNHKAPLFNRLPHSIGHIFELEDPLL